MKRKSFIFAIIFQLLFTGVSPVLQAQEPTKPEMLLSENFLATFKTGHPGLDISAENLAALLPQFATDASMQSWQNMKTVKEVCDAFPKRMNALMQSLNLNFNGLNEVKAAYEINNIPLTCELLLKYYREGSTAKFFRQNLPVNSKSRNSEADSILQNIFIFYNQPDRVPLDSAGHLDWTFHGPANDIEWAWALNRHYHIGTLLEAYLKTGNTDYAKTIDLHIKDWVIRSLPYPEVRSNTEMWRGLEVSFRAKIWARVFYNLINSEYLYPATRLLMLSSIPEHAHYLRNFHAQGNWLTMEMSGLATIATAWPESKNSPSWIAYAKETMLKSMTEQVYPDGVQTELTSSYHQVALDNFNLFMEICQQTNEPLPELYKTYLEKMWNYLAYTMRPDGYGLLNNDADLTYTRELISKAALQYNQKDWQYIATNGEMGTKPQGAPSTLFPWAGHLIMRSGFEPDAQWAFFDIGPWGTGHQHNDKLHISVSAYGRDLLVDAGRFAYRGELADKFRDYACGSYSHNVILIDGNGQAPGPKLTNEPLSKEHYKISDGFDYAWSSFNQFVDLKGECNYTRSLFYLRGKFWVVVDNIATDRPRKIETLWHWHPDCKIKVESKNIVSTDNDKGNLKIIPIGYQKWNIDLVKGQEKPYPQGWYSEEYNKAVPSTVSIYSTEIKRSTSFVCILYPSEGNVSKIQAKILSQDEEGVKVRVADKNEGQWKIVIPFSNSSEASLNYSSYSTKID